MELCQSLSAETPGSLCVAGTTLQSKALSRQSKINFFFFPVYFSPVHLEANCLGLVHCGKNLWTVLL